MFFQVVNEVNKIRTMVSNSPVIQRIQQFNQGRDPQQLQLKFAKMREDVFSFFRGTCHLFYEDFDADWAASELDQAPLTWISGDLHLENFGCYKGDDRQVYFDINDFDESVLAPCTWELARLLTSIFVAMDALDLPRSLATDLSQHCLDRYIAELKTGKARVVTVETATGEVEGLIKHLQDQKRSAFLDQQTEVERGERRIKRVQNKREELTPETRSQLKEWLEQWSEQWSNTQDDPGFYQFIDATKRIAGNSSLGLNRYLILVAGKGSPDRNYLLDLKQSRSASLSSPAPQPDWESEAERITAIQTRMQAIAPALLHAVEFNHQPYVLRELQPTEDKLKLKDLNLDQWQPVVMTMGAIAAWGQLRSSGRDGSAIADALIGFAERTDWQESLLRYAREYAQRVREDFQAWIG